MKRVIYTFVWAIVALSILGMCAHIVAMTDTIVVKWLAGFGAISSIGVASLMINVLVHHES